MKECIIQDDPQNKDFDLGKIRGVVDRVGITPTFKRSGEFGIKDIEQDLSRLLANDNAGVLPQTELKLAMGAASALIRYLGVRQSLILHSIYLWLLTEIFLSS